MPFRKWEFKIKRLKVNIFFKKYMNIQIIVHLLSFEFFTQL